MRTGLLSIGLILLVLSIGVILFSPSEQAGVVQRQLSLIAMIIGCILTILGWVFPDSENTYHEHEFKTIKIKRCSCGKEE